PETNDELKRVKQEIRAKSVARIEKQFVLQALNQYGWNVTRTARQVGLKRSNFQAMMRKHGVKRPGAG
ncbi:MAG: sigma-54-dependent Fis family transcriptional regulator, partial [Desulfatitalea sp.]|nr:sigma-54-dependent Fis family transcriptional regulator [Desulfatitalea sp.]NNK01647.1 sigma-54-dependent Fis family transcriptional regulator [Desulfatitalea sp.]